MPRTIIGGAAVAESYGGTQAADIIVNPGQSDDQAILPRLRVEDGGDPSGATLYSAGTLPTGISPDSGGAGFLGALGSLIKRLADIRTAVQGTLLVTRPVATASTPTSVAASASPVTLFAANSGARKGALVYNDAGSSLYLLLGAGASTSTFTYKLDPNGGYYELPQPLYQGVVTGVWDVASGNARCTELS